MALKKFFCEDNHLTDLDTSEYSLDQRYMITIQIYRTREYCWNYTQALVYHADTQKLIVDLRRNYDDFWYQWLFIPSGDYLLCAQHYQGYSVVNLATGKVKDYVPSEAKRNEGFIWGRTLLSPQQTKVLVIGHCFGMKSDLRVYDLSSLDQNFTSGLHLPFREYPILMTMPPHLLQSTEDIFKTIEVEWTNDTVFTGVFKNDNNDNEIITGVIIEYKID